MPGGREPRWESTVAQQKADNIHLRKSQTEDEFVSLRESRDRTLPMPKLILLALQVNIAGGRLPEPERATISQNTDGCAQTCDLGRVTFGFEILRQRARARVALRLAFLYAFPHADHDAAVLAYGQLGGKLHGNKGRGREGCPAACH